MSENIKDDASMINPSGSEDLNDWEEKKEFLN
ncbi:MAG: hypothetical protein UR31_C0025G0010 [Parcubacteria group bacterium GW2011_GWA2_33_14]|nr:MAG: hypothetical protein UR31_C0025G0010 [Parcubacteria group bacterium GW2011_GWA2_33_14]